ncbi:MAG: RDD family protein [Hyphomicrobiaceae bacterium]
MADYDPPQPFWKRAIAGILDFLLIFFAGGLAIQAFTGGGAVGAGDGVSFKLEGLPALALFVLVIAYFAGLGRTGGTLFQRLFGMRRRA